MSNNGLGFFQPLLGCGNQQWGQGGEPGGTEIGLHRTGFHLSTALTAHRPPDLLAQRVFWQSTVGHPQTQLQALMAEVKG